jgi:hypothetical protein
MQQSRYLVGSLIILLIAACIAPAGAYATPESIVAAGKVYVSNVSFDPGVFISGDTGTATYTVTNGNTDLGVVVNHAALTDPSQKIRVVGGTHQSSAQIGPGKSHTFTFTVNADGVEGFYYPVFSLSFRDADSLFAREMIQIDNTPLLLTVKDKPDAFTQGKKKTIYMQVANPRKNTAKSVILEISGEGADFTPSRIFVGSIGPGQTVPVNFSVTPNREAPIQLTLNYNNGDNLHTVSKELPLIFGTDKKSAEPVMSNVQVKNIAGKWHVTGDVNNAGLETANTVMVTSLSPAVPEDPYKIYVVGALKPDDFGSFEITFTADTAETIPVKLSYKDADGNIYDTIQDVKIGASGIRVDTGSSGFPVVPVAAGIIVLVIFIGGWAYHLRRNKK